MSGALAAARDFLEALTGYSSQPAGGNVPSQDRPMRIGTIDPAYSGTGNAKVTFDGESLLGVKTYVVMVPVAASDRVVLAPVGRSYVILGKLGGTPFATNAETIAGLLATRAVTPASLAALTATETRRGLAEKASSAEVVALTDGERFVVPSTLKSVLGAQHLIGTAVLGAGGTRTLNADGSVSFSGAVTSVGLTFGTVADLDDLEEIEVILEYEGSVAGNHTWAVCLNGTPNTTGSAYTNKGQTDTGEQAASTSTGFSQGYVGSRRMRHRTLHLRRLADATKTRFWETGIDDDDGASPVWLRHNAGIHNQNTAYNGVLFTLNGLTTLSNGRILAIGKR